MAQTEKILATQNLMTLVQDPQGGRKELTHTYYGSCAPLCTNAHRHAEFNKCFLKKILHDETIWENSHDFICMRLKEK